MGIPEFLRQVVLRTGDKALARPAFVPPHIIDAMKKGERQVPKDLATIRAAATVYDFVVVDVTNQLQLLSPLQELLCCRIRVTKAIILILDGARERRGSSRATRRFQSERDADLAIADLTSTVLTFQSGMAQVASEQSNAPPKKRCRPENKLLGVSPIVLTLGRDIAGEGDFKLLGTIRHILAHGSNEEVTRILAVSDDSDVLCGLMCGPQSNNIWLASTLRGAMSGTTKVLASSIAEISEWGLLNVADVSAALCSQAGILSNANWLKSASQLDRSLASLSSCIDYCFLFALVLGTSLTPPIIRGSTKVDVGSVWDKYCQTRAATLCVATQARCSLKFDDDCTTDGIYAPVFPGQCLLSPSPQSSDECMLNSMALQDVLKVLQVSLATDIVQAASPDERKKAKKYLKTVMSLILNYVVGGPVTDTRDDEINQNERAPSLAAIAAVLEEVPQLCVSVKLNWAFRRIDVREVTAEQALPAVVVPVSFVGGSPEVVGPFKIYKNNATLPSPGRLPTSLSQLWRQWTKTCTQSSTPSQSTASYSFGLRRMVKVAAPSEQTSSSEGLQEVLSAANVSLDY